MPGAGKRAQSLTQPTASGTSKDLKRNLRVCTVLWLEEPGGRVGVSRFLDHPILIFFPHCSASSGVVFQGY